MDWIRAMEVALVANMLTQYDVQYFTPQYNKEHQLTDANPTPLLVKTEHQ